MKQKVVAILSILKPVDDTRNFEKIASSISNTNKYDINIIGFSTKNLPAVKNITFYPIGKFHRLSAQRALAHLKIARILLKLKPQLIIVTCAELLPVICLYKILFGSKIIYDVQENYYRNIIYTDTYPLLFRYPIGFAIRLIEYIASPFVSRFFLAEKIYSSQLNFIGSRYEVFENKAIILSDIRTPVSKTPHKTTFLYSGTIATHYGIFEAIQFINKMHLVDNHIELKIVGFAPDQRVYKKLLKAIDGHDYIKLEGGDRLIVHNQILKEIDRADFCLLPYRKNKGSEGRIPTKLFECLALETPVIISPNLYWDSLIRENNAGIIYDFLKNDLPKKELFNKNYYGNDLSQNYLWDSEAEILLAAVERLI